MSSSTNLAYIPAGARTQTRRVDGLVALHKAVRQIASILELDELLQTIVHRVAVDFGYIESNILLVEGNKFHLAATHGCTHAKKGERWPITEGLSAQVVSTGSTYYAPDVGKEPFYRPCEPDTRSEVIIPLRVRSRVIGVFAASHHEMDAFPREQIEILEALAVHIAIAIDNALRIWRERLQNQHLHEEREEACRIQQNLLPRKGRGLPGVHLEGACSPASAVSGDWYDYISLDDGRLGLVLADVSGKGMPAALLMSAVRGIIRSVAPLASGPAQVLARVNQLLLDDFLSGRYVTMIYAVLDPTRRMVIFANAGHPSPLHCRGSDVHPLHSDAGMPLGLFQCDFTEHTVHLCDNVRLLLYTDGISEAVNAAGQEFGTTRLRQFLARSDCTVLQLMQAVKEFRGDCEQRDDATAVLLKSM